ncbi:hypothetical protein [Celeribacter sp.]|uniref:hypothetical protein n=1 Tax=Celeribacter sp. TaxID=1890673 RepID=UPI003A8ED806
MTHATHHIAERNIGRLIAAPDDLRVAGFVGALERPAYTDEHGDSDHAFGWSYMTEATLYSREKLCAHSRGVTP